MQERRNHIDPLVDPGTTDGLCTEDSSIRAVIHELQVHLLRARIVSRMVVRVNDHALDVEAHFLGGREAQPRHGHVELENAHHGRAQHACGRSRMSGCGVLTRKPPVPICCTCQRNSRHKVRNPLGHFGGVTYRVNVRVARA